MTPDFLFQIANPLAMAGWVVLILAPRRWAVLGHVPRTAVPLLLAALYSALVLAHFFTAEGGYDSLANVALLFETPEVLLAGWVHYLAFDLMIGALMADRMDRAGVSRVLQAPLLVTIFLFGPMGVLLALATEGAVRLLPARSEALA